jgi:hypothetical protein
VVGKIAPGTERKQIERRKFVFRGYFELDAEGTEKVRSSCDDRPYPIFHLVDLVDERLMELGEAEPKVLRGPGRIEVIAPPPPIIAAPVEPKAQEPAAKNPAKRRYRGKRKRKMRRRVKPRRQRTP